MSKSELIETIEKLQALKNKTEAMARKAKTLSDAARLKRRAFSLGSVCDRLTFNWTMLNDGETQCQRDQAARFLNETLTEATLFLD